MPLPERYLDKVPEMKKIWEPEGYFKAQTEIWAAQSEARHELYGEPTAEQLAAIKKALVITPEDVEELTEGKGHETNKLLRKVQGRIEDPEAGNFVHLGNTSSDVLDTSAALQVRASLEILESDFDILGDSLLNLALRHRFTPQVGRSHGQHAVPQTFGRQVIGWYAEVMRGYDRVQQAKDVMAVGKISGEVGTHVFLPPELEELTLEKLGLVPDEAPTQVISRDRYAEMMGLLAVNGGTLGRIARNIRTLSRPEIGELREPFDEVGSSAMPHKKNPELSERISGINRRIRSTVIEELDAMILDDERDISHSSTERFTLPDAFGALSYATRLTTEVIDGLVVYPNRMAANLELTNGAIYSPQLLNALLGTKQMTRTEAYKLIQGLAQQAMEGGPHLKELANQDPTLINFIGTERLANLFDLDFYLRNVDVAFRRTGALPSTS